MASKVDFHSLQEGKGKLLALEREALASTLKGNPERFRKGRKAHKYGFELEWSLAYAMSGLPADVVNVFFERLGNAVKDAKFLAQYPSLGKQATARFKEEAQQAQLEYNGLVRPMNQRLNVSKIVAEQLEASALVNSLLQDLGVSVLWAGCNPAGTFEDLCGARPMTDKERYASFMITVNAANAGTYDGQTDRSHRIVGPEDMIDFPKDRVRYAIGNFNAGQGHAEWPHTGIGKFANACVVVGAPIMAVTGSTGIFAHQPMPSELHWDLWPYLMGSKLSTRLPGWLREDDKAILQYVDWAIGSDRHVLLDLNEVHGGKPDKKRFACLRKHLGYTWTLPLRLVLDVSEKGILSTRVETRIDGMTATPLDFVLRDLTRFAAAAWLTENASPREIVSWENLMRNYDAGAHGGFASRMDWDSQSLVAKEIMGLFIFRWARKQLESMGMDPSVIAPFEKAVELNRSPASWDRTAFAHLTRQGVDPVTAGQMISVAHMEEELFSANGICEWPDPEDAFGKQLSAWKRNGKQSLQA